MNEIEKLYENAGLSKEVIPCLAKYYGYDCTRNNWDDADCSCDIEGYPPFTAEKQLELIKWLMKEEKVLQIELCYIEDDFCFSRVTPCETNINANYVSFGRARKFEEALADLINDIWQDLTEEEKGQIKEILE